MVNFNSLNARGAVEHNNKVSPSLVPLTLRACDILRKDDLAGMRRMGMISVNKNGVTTL